MVSILDALIFMVFVTILVVIYIRRKWTVLNRWNIPHDPPSIMNLGNMRVVLSDRYFTYELECKEKYGPVWGYYTITSPRIVIHDPNILEQVMVKEFSSFPNRFSSNPQVGGTDMRNGLPWISGDQWKRVRTTMTPTFSTGKLREMAAIINWCTDNTVDAITRRINEDNGFFTAKDTFNKLALDVICSTAFSQNVNSQDERNDVPMTYKQALAFFQSGVLNFASLVTIALPFLSPVFLWMANRMTHIIYFRKLCMKLIEARENNPHAHKKRVDLMQLMIASKITKEELVKSGVRRGLLQNEIVGNAMTMLLAGFETTGISMAYFAYNLAIHPDVQKRLQKEIDDMCRESENINFDAVCNLKYLDMCLNESLRLYSPATRTIRTAEQEVTVSGLTIPKGAMVCIPLYAMSHDPDYWENPMEYNPERMRNVGNINQFVFQPFGGGPRKCIGARFAVSVIKLAFYKFLHHFTFEPIEETPKPPLQLSFDLVSKAKVNYKLRAVPRP